MQLPLPASPPACSLSLWQLNELNILKKRIYEREIQISVSISKVLQENSRPTHWHTVCGCCFSTAAEVNSCDRDRMTCHAWNLYSLVLYTESLLPFVLVFCGNVSKERSRTHASSLHSSTRSSFLSALLSYGDDTAQSHGHSRSLFCFLTGWLKTHILHLPYFYFGT